MEVIFMDTWRRRAAGPGTLRRLHLQEPALSNSSTRARCFGGAWAGADSQSGESSHANWRIVIVRVYWAGIGPAFRVLLGGGSEARPGSCDWIRARSVGAPNAGARVRLPREGTNLDQERPSRAGFSIVARREM